MTLYNKKTGRPIRKSAGSVRQAGFVDSSLLDVEDVAPWTSDDSDDEDEAERRRNASKKSRKRKRSPSPPSPCLAPTVHDQEAEQLTDNELGGTFHRRDPKRAPISLQFNVP